MKIPMDPNNPMINQPQQTVVVVPSQINQEIKELIWTIVSLIDSLEKSAFAGLSDDVTKGVAKRALFFFMDIKRVNVPDTLDQAQIITKQVDMQKEIILRRWGKDVLNDMLMDYDTAINKKNAEDVEWNKKNVN